MAAIRRVLDGGRPASNKLGDCRAVVGRALARRERQRAEAPIRIDAASVTTASAATEAAFQV